MTGNPIPTLVDPGWLESSLSDPDLRVLDCTIRLEFDADGNRHTAPDRVGWQAGHVPGSVYADIQNDLSAPDPAFPYERPSAERFAAAMEALGVGDSTRVVCYDRAGNGWAARVWWLLRSFGFDRAGVLDGGWDGWVRAGRPVSIEPPAVRNVAFTPEPRPELFVDRDAVRAAMHDDGVCLVNALGPEDFVGTGPVKYGRPGRIPGSCNVPATGEDAVVTETCTYRPVSELDAMFDAAGVTDCDRVITYCGGGIAASSVAFALHRIGVTSVAVYDGSLSEWGRTDLPMETGPPS